MSPIHLIKYITRNHQMHTFIFKMLFGQHHHEITSRTHNLYVINSIIETKRSSTVKNENCAHHFPHWIWCSIPPYSRAVPTNIIIKPQFKLIWSPIKHLYYMRIIFMVSAYIYNNIMMSLTYCILFAQELIWRTLPMSSSNSIQRVVCEF